MESSLSVISSIGFSIKLLPNLRAIRFSPMLSSRIFRGLPFVFSSMVHFEFCEGWRSESRLFFTCGYSFVPEPFVEKIIFACCIAFAPFSKISWLYLWELISWFSTLFHWLIHLSLSLFFFFLIPYCLEYCSCRVRLKFR